MRKLLFVLIPIPLLFTACSTNNVTVEDSLQRFFDSAGVKGTFALFDNGQGHFTIHNLSRYRDSAYPPGATFDIMQSLIALQTGVATSETSVIGALMLSPNNNSDTIMARELRHDTSDLVRSPVRLLDAFQAPWGETIFMTLARSIGRDTLKKWIDSLRYGNRDMNGSIDSFWLDGHLTITPDEQLGLTKKLYFGQLPFFRRTQDLVRNMMTREVNSNYKLVYKPGSISYKDHELGWMMGWVEENKHPYFFVLNFDHPDPYADVTGIGLQLVKRILASQGFFRGTK